MSSPRAAHPVAHASTCLTRPHHVTRLHRGRDACRWVMSAGALVLAGCRGPQSVLDPAGHGGWPLVHSRCLPLLPLRRRACPAHASAARRPDNTLLSADFYNQVFTLHGSVMMFLFALPIFEAIAVMFLPQMLGARDLPFPRLSAFGFFAFLLGGIFLCGSLFFDAAPRGGWFMYPPLTSEYQPGIGADIWLLGLLVHRSGRNCRRRGNDHRRAQNPPTGDAH